MDRTPAPDVRSTPKERGYHEKSYLLQGLGYKKDVKKKTKKSELTEDDQKNLEKELQDQTDKRCKEIDELTAKKEKELMAV